MENKHSASTLPAFDLQGHRGCRGLMPENTIAAMHKAIDLGVTTLEMDAVITKDGKVVLSHDPFFSHEITTKPDGTTVTEQEEKELNIYRMTYEQVLQYDVGLKPHPRFPQQKKLQAVKPLLSHVIDSVEQYLESKKRKAVFYNIETKSQLQNDLIYHPAPEEFVVRLINVIQSKGIENRVVIQSFDPRTLQVVHQKYPSIKTSLLIEEDDHKPLPEHLAELGFLPTIYSPYFKLVDTNLIAACHDKNIKVIPWTINDLSTMKQLKAWGVDGLISDYPNLYASLH